VGSHVYWTDWKTEGVHRADKYNGSDSRMIVGNITGSMDKRSVQVQVPTYSRHFQKRPYGDVLLALVQSVSHLSLLHRGEDSVEHTLWRSKIQHFFLYLAYTNMREKGREK